MTLSKFQTCLWFKDEASIQEAAKLYTSVFPDSKILNTQYYTKAGTDISGGTPGNILTIDLILNGQPFLLLNGGNHPGCEHNNAISFIIECKDQAEVDYYWEKLGEGGADDRKVCGWCADKWGIAWQVVPKVLLEYMRDEDKKKVERTTVAMMGMKKMDIEGLTKAYEGRE